MKVTEDAGYKGRLLDLSQRPGSDPRQNWLNFEAVSLECSEGPPANLGVA